MKKDAKKIKISACMMVKNEEEMLPRCLNSIKHLIDELIIVDTGSTDKTVEIAQSFGAKIYHHPWEDNFSKHRNQSLSYATGDWIIQIDADEELNGYHLKKESLKKVFANAPDEQHCFLIKLLDKNKKGEVTTTTEMIRIFKNHVGVHFEGIVHNRPVYSGKVGHIDIEFFHYGYALSEEQMQAKYKRTSGLLFKRINENPEDHDAYFYLYQVHSEMGEKEKAVQYAMRCLELVEKKGINPTEASFYNSLYYGISSVYLKSGKYDEALLAIRKGLDVLPEEVDLYYNMAALGYFSGQPNLSIEGGKDYFQIVDKFRSDPSRSGTRFIFTTSKNAEITVCFWLMTGLIAEGLFAEFSDLWEKYKEDMLEKPGFQKELFKLFEKKEAFECLESVAVFLLNNLEKIHAANHQMIYSFLVFYLRERKAYQKESNRELDALFKNVAGSYLNALASYNDMPTADAVVIAEYLLENSMGQFFLDLTLVLFEREVAGQIKVIDTDETIIDGYTLIAKKQEQDRKGKLISLLCLRICERLSESKQSRTVEDGISKRESISSCSDQNVSPIKCDLSEDDLATPHVLKKNRIPLVCVGLPVFNGGLSLINAIESILNQDFEDFELIISDNCSTDETEETCRRYANKDNRIYYTRLDKNYGKVVNWRNVFGLARGEYFVFAQHENTFYPQFIRSCLDELIHENSIEIVFPQINLFDDRTKHIPYSDPLNVIQDDPLERYLHVLEKMDLNTPLLGMMRQSVLRKNRTFFGSLTTQLVFGDLPTVSEIALRGKVKQINKILLNRKKSANEIDNLQQRIVKLINTIGPCIINEGISLPYSGIIRKQMEVIKYADISFSQKDFLIKESIKCLKNRFQPFMSEEIRRAISLINANSFFTTWDGRTLPINVLNSLEHFKREYLTTLCRDLQDALLIFPEWEELIKVVKIIAT